MKTMLLCSVAAALALLLIPSRDSVTAAKEQNVVLLIAPESAPSAASEPEGAPAAAPQTVLLRTCSGEIQTEPEAAYLTEVLLSEMPASFEPEALCAQAVAARTFLARQRLAGKHQDCDICASSDCCQAWTSREALAAKFGDAFQAAWDKAAAAIAQTDGEILTFDGQPIDAVYFSCSGGSTEAAVAVWGTDIPYLQSVASPGEQDAVRDRSDVCVSAAELRTILTAAAPEIRLSGPAETWFSDPVFTEGGGVDTLEIGTVCFSGTQIRSLLGLNSTKFTVECAEETVTFHVSGFGHRVGMSQYGANAMAKLGFDYRAILQYYYRGVKIEKASQAEA